jgi:hypothetical protein
MQSPPARETPYRGKVRSLTAEQTATSFRANSGSVKTPAYHGVNPYNLIRLRKERTTMHSQRQSLLCRLEDALVAASIPSGFMTQVSRSSVEAVTVQCGCPFRSCECEQPNLNFPGGPTPTSTAREQMESRPA